MDWDSWSKPWSREQCKIRYVQGDRISLRGMARASGRSKSSMERWSAEDTWEDERSQYQTSVKTATREKTIEKASERLSEELADIAIANFKAHKLARDYALTIFKIKAMHLKQIQERMQLQEIDPEQLSAEIKKHHNAAEMNFWSHILSRSTQEISAATGLPYYVNINTSAKKLEQEGYVVLDPRQESDE